MYKCKYFEIHELVPPQVYKDRGEKAWKLLDDRLLETIDILRDKFGSTTINNYYWGGDRQWSGLRTPDSPYYSPYSQHTFGRAADLVFKNYTAQTVRDWLKNNDHYLKAPYLPVSFTVEEGVDWCHIDTRNNEDGYNSFWP